MPRAEHWLYTIFYGGPLWVRDLFRKKQSEQELEEELSFHLERQIHEDIAHGMAPEEARQRAASLRRGIEHARQECRDVRRINPLEDLIKDAVHATRTLRRAPTFAITSIITIALGVGLSTAIFSVTHAVLLRALPYPGASRLVMALRDMPKRGVRDYPASGPDFLDVRNQSKAAFEDLAALAVTVRSAVLPKADGSPEQVHIQSATPNLFSLLGAKLAAGRAFTESDGEVGPRRAEPVLLSYEYWMRRYAGDDAVVGRPIPEIGAVVAGVLAPGFEVLLPPRLGLDRSPELWTPYRLSNNGVGRNAGQLRMIGRLKAGVGLAQAQAALDRIGGEFEQKFPVKATSGFAIRLEPMRHYLVADVQPTILALTGAVLFLLLIACANVANLVLIRTSLREREFAMRASLGGTMLRLTRQLIAEALVLVAIGAAAGIGLAWAAVDGLHRIAPSNPSLANLPRLDSIEISPAVAAFAILISLAIAAAFGVAAAYRAARPDVVRVLRSSGSTGANSAGATAAGGRTRFRTCMVALEIALSFVLLIGAGLMFRSFLVLENVGLGYDSRGVLIFRVTGIRGNSQQRGAFITQLESHLHGLPGVEAVTSSSALPLAGGFTVIRWGREDEQPDSIAGAADFQSVRPGYFEAMRMPLLEGRTFTQEDNSPDRKLLVVDDQLAAREFPSGSAVGRRIVASVPGLQGPQPFEIIGVVAHQRDTSLAEAGREQIYAAEGLAGHPVAGYWVVRTAEDRLTCGKHIRAELSKLDPAITVTEMQPMTAFVERAQASTRFSLLLIGVFAGIAALLAGVGLYGVLATMVRQRTAEIGIRIAMGATPWSIFRLVAGRGMLLSGAGLAAGMLASLLLTRAMTTLLVGVKPTDPVTFAAMAALFLGIAAVASWLPARRAAALEASAAVKE